MVIRNDLSAIVGQAQQAVERVARCVDAGSCASGAAHSALVRTARVMRGVLPSSTSSGMSTGGADNTDPTTRMRPSPVSLARPPQKGSARARTAPRTRSTLLGREREHVALLRLVAPDLHRRHARFGARYLAQVDRAAAPAVRDGFGQGVRQPAGAHIVDQQNRIRPPKRPATVDDLLSAALHFRHCRAAPMQNPDPAELCPLPTEEAAPPPNPISMDGSAEHHERRADPHVALLDVRCGARCRVRRRS